LLQQRAHPVSHFRRGGDRIGKSTHSLSYAHRRCEHRLLAPASPGRRRPHRSLRRRRRPRRRPRQGSAPEPAWEEDVSEGPRQSPRGRRTPRRSWGHAGAHRLPLDPPLLDQELWSTTSDSSGSSLPRCSGLPRRRFLGREGQDRRPPRSSADSPPASSAVEHTGGIQRGSAGAWEKAALALAGTCSALLACCGECSM